MVGKDEDVGGGEPMRVEEVVVGGRYNSVEGELGEWVGGRRSRVGIATVEGCGEW